MRLTVHERISDIGARRWNAVAGCEYPFLRYEFLQAAEFSGSVSAEEGWQPRHLELTDDDGELRGLMPLYAKSHSWGEFVFDWAWANAYERAGLDYYPKLVSTVPFTPATSPRLLLADDADPEAAQALLRGAMAYAEQANCSSVHVLFPLSSELEQLEAAGFRTRRDCQFHWQNRDYADFDGFLASFSSRKRKKARRDRRRVREAGIRFRHLLGRDIDKSTWNQVYALISRTFLQRGSMPYYRQSFFEQVASALPEQLLVVLAEFDEEIVATAVFFVGARTLYGRYWGSNGHYDALHFETCYYQGIEYCIANGIDSFEPGTQGEHKISRGFLPAGVTSAHWLAEPRFFAAIGDYVAEEARHVARYMQAVDDHSPYRKVQP